MKRLLTSEDVALIQQIYKALAGTHSAYMRRRLQSALNLQNVSLKEKYEIQHIHKKLEAEGYDPFSLAAVDVVLPRETKAYAILMNRLIDYYEEDEVSSKQLIYAWDNANSVDPSLVLKLLDTIGDANQVIGLGMLTLEHWQNAFALLGRVDLMGIMQPIIFRFGQRRYKTKRPGVGPSVFFCFFRNKTQEKTSCHPEGA